MSERGTVFMVNNKNNRPMGAQYTWRGSIQMLVAVSLLAAFSMGSAGSSNLSPSPPLSVAAVNASSADNLALSVVLADELSTVAGDITWHIRAADGNLEQRHLGHSPTLRLPNGQYEVTLSIGTYTSTQTVNVVEGKLSKLPFIANVGRLRVNSSHPADWKIIAQHGEDAGKIVSTGNDNKILNTLLLPGEYEVLANRGDGIQHSQRLQVSSGKLSAANIQMPSGKVTLVATLDNGPALRPMNWTVYRLDGGRQTIATPRRHSANLEVAPGQYEAVATLDGQERRRAFTVLTGTSNRIVIAMD